MAPHRVQNAAGLMWEKKEKWALSKLKSALHVTQNCHMWTKRQTRSCWISHHQTSKAFQKLHHEKVRIKTLLHQCQSINCSMWSRKLKRSSGHCASFCSRFKAVRSGQVFAENYLFYFYKKEKAWETAAEQPAEDSSPLVCEVKETITKELTCCFPKTNIIQSYIVSFPESYVHNGRRTKEEQQRNETKD